MRCFRRVIDPLVPAVLHAGGEFRLRGRVGPQLVGHHHPRQAPSLEELAHEPFGGFGVSPRLNENVQDVAVRIDRPPQPMLRAVDLENDLVEVPPVGRPRPVASDLRCNLCPELRDPDPDRFMGYDDPSLGQKVFNVAQAQGEAVIRPDGVADDGAREAMPLEAGEVVEIQHPGALLGLCGTINLTMPSGSLSLEGRGPDPPFRFGTGTLRSVEMPELPYTYGRGLKLSGM